MAKQDDGLFLLEVLIDKIVFVKSPCFSDKDFRTCVRIECPAVEPLEICDDDPGACVAKSGGPFVKTFNNGKSCLFSLKESDISASMSKFPVKISVYKSLPCGCLPTKIVMGEAIIDMTKEFVQARRKFLEDPSVVSYQALKDSFRITGPDGTETGEIVMFLRISCFGKLIITRFQGAGAGGPPTLGGGSGANSIVDRSCNPKREFQSSEDPCACGAARGGPSGSGGQGGSRSGAPCAMCGASGAICPTARDPYNSMPCQDPDDPCYCTGPKPPTKQQMACRNTDQYCLHVPKGTLPFMPYTQDLTEDQKMDIKITCMQMYQFHKCDHEVSKFDDYYEVKTSMQNNNDEYLRFSIDHFKLPRDYKATEKYSATSCSTIRSCKRRSVSFSENINYVSNSHKSSSSLLNVKKPNMHNSSDIFGNKETTVFMTLFDEFCRFRNHGTQSTTGTQATASINKCLQVRCKESESNAHVASSLGTNSNYFSSCTMSTLPYQEDRNIDRLRYSDVYFFGRKKDEAKQEKDKMGMGKSSRKYRTGETTTTPVKVESNTAQTRNRVGSSAGTSTKQVSIKEEKQCPNDKPCPAIAAVKGDMMATVSHIRLGPREPCPVHGKDPCQGPNCIVASSGSEQAPVKVTTMTNPRRGVFELVIRRISGAPLAKNELMLEWTPPPSRPPSCLQPACSLPSPPMPCRPSKCKMIVCRPSPCKPKGCRKPCGLPCRSVPCKPKPCSPCAPPRCCKPCRPCPPPRKIFKRPCPPPCCKRCKSPCKPCPPTPCSFCSLCASPPCKPSKPCRPCRPSPCRPPRCRPPPCKPCRRCRSPSPRKPCRRCKPCPTTPCERCKPGGAVGSAPCGGPCVPCPPALCAPCPPSPCFPLCCKSPCSSPCKSSPCLRPCPIVCRKMRKCKSSPKIKARRKRISPCCNRSKNCPVVRCRSVPGPCFGCCRVPPCPPRKCCSISPCKPPKCCKSSCSTCCG